MVSVNAWVPLTSLLPSFGKNINQNGDVCLALAWLSLFHTPMVFTVVDKGEKGTRLEPELVICERRLIDSGVVAWLHRRIADDFGRRND